MTSPRIGYIGLGALGSAIFPNIVSYAKDNGLPAPAMWNRSQDKYAPVKEAYPDVYSAAEVEELVPRSDIIFTCLVNDAAAEEVYTKLAAALKKEDGAEKKVFADQTTLKASTARECNVPACGREPSALPFLRRPRSIITNEQSKSVISSRVQEAHTSPRRSLASPRPPKSGRWSASRRAIPKDARWSDPSSSTLAKRSSTSETTTRKVCPDRHPRRLSSLTHQAPR